MYSNCSPSGDHRGLKLCWPPSVMRSGQVPSVLEEIRSELRNIQQEDIRRASQELYPSIVKAGLVPAVRSAVNRFSNDIQVELSIEPEIVRREKDDQRYYPEEYRLGVYRIVEEALDRLVKSSQATLAKVSVGCENNEYLSIQLSDNGSGIGTEGGEASDGMAGIRDYAQLLGGSCEVCDPDGPGARLRVLLPFPQRGPTSNGFGIRQDSRKQAVQRT